MSEYLMELVEDDERLCELIARRYLAGKDKEGGMPDEEHLVKWSKQFDLDIFYLKRFFSVLMTPHWSRPFRDPIQLRTVIPLLRTAHQEGIVYQFTHMMQYENCSVVSLDIRIEDENSGQQLGMPELILALPGGGYHVQVTHSGGGGHRYAMSFTVTPPLPDEIDGVQFTLEPHVRFPERFEATVLKERVEFSS